MNQKPNNSKDLLIEGLKSEVNCLKMEVKFYKDSDIFWKGIAKNLLLNSDIDKDDLQAAMSRSKLTIVR